ncbi:glycoside hydrolase family 28 protein [Arachidicoccus sp.]|uniref:glycoside hydrolase family 28 protein n=1 Tax=Arachidicoccus sp. TaxID=1872624 RepID=UPI003D1B4B81
MKGENVLSIFTVVLIFVSAFALPSNNFDNNLNNNTEPVLDWAKNVGAREMPKATREFSVNKYGAIGDGATKNTAAIQKAIDACAAAGGGIVTFNKGTYLTGSIFVKSGVTLKIDEGVKIVGSQNIDDYTLIETRVAGIEMKWPAALINVLNQKNVAIIGEGIVDGRGKIFWDKYWTMRKIYDPKGIRWAADYDCRRPRLFLISNSSDITLKGLHLQRAGFWTVHILYSNHVTVDGITIQNNIGGHGPSTDGIDIDSSDYILVQNCDVNCNDDDYCLKAGRDADGLRVNKPTEYVVIRHCIARSGGGLCTFGSETSGSIRHVLVENSEAIGTGNGVNFKSAFTRGGTVEDIHIQNLKMKNVKTAIHLNLNWNPNYSYTTLPKDYNYDSIPPYWKVMLEKVSPERGKPTIQNVFIQNVFGTGCATAISATGMKTSLLKDVHLTDIHIASNTAGGINYGADWHFKNVRLKTNDNGVLKIENSTNVKL